MQKSNIASYNLPESPGVYKFFTKKGSRKELLYIGRATSLKDRVRSYFAPDLIATRGPRIVDMVTSANYLEYIETDSILEAIIEESLLIKKYQPPANVKERDDKSFAYVVITREEFPRVLVVRGRELTTFVQHTPPLYEFGPFPQGNLLKEALRIIRKIFPFYDSRHSISSKGKHHRAVLEFNRQITRAPREEDHERYRQNIHHIALFLQGKKKRVLREIEMLMKKSAKEERFEDAKEYKRQLYALTHIQDISLIKEDLKRTPNIRIEAFDVAHIQGTSTVGVMVQVVDGERVPKNYRSFTIKTKTNDDIGSLKELLIRRFGHYEWQFPHMIVIDGGATHKKAAEKVLHELGLPLPVVAVVKDEHHRPKRIIGMTSVTVPERDIILANAEAHRFSLAKHRGLRTKRSFS